MTLNVFENYLKANSDTEFWMPVNLYRKEEGQPVSTGETKILRCKISDWYYNLPSSGHTSTEVRVTVTPVEPAYRASSFITCLNRLVLDFVDNTAVVCVAGDVLEENSKIRRQLAGNFFEELTADVVKNGQQVKLVRLRS